jgi:Fe2+ or Zn2+ uptake regulation protein
VTAFEGAPSLLAESFPPVTASELRTAILAYLESRPPVTAYKISAAMRKKFPYGASTPRVRKALAAMEKTGELRRVLEPRTRADKRQAVRWELAPHHSTRGTL